MTNIIKAVTNDEKVILFNNQQEAATYLGVTKQAIAKAMKHNNICKGARLSLVYRTYRHSGDSEKNLIVDGQLLGTYENREIKYGNVFLKGFKPISKEEK